jgi:hypothetical protein
MHARRLTGLAVFAAIASVALAASQAPAAAPVRPALTAEQMDTFLRTAKIVSSRAAGSGVTGTRRVTMSDGAITHDAQVQAIDEDKAVYRVQGYTEFNFRDCFCFNIAAYRLAVLLGIDNVPMSVERVVDGKPSAVTWWVDDVAMTEEGRRKSGATDPNPGRFDHYRYRQRVFDELIQNRDRNLGNLIYTKDWTMWMIDHTRAFRLNRDLGKPGELLRIERPLYENLKRLTVESLTAAVGKSLRRPEIEAVVARRDEIIKVLDERIARLSEAAVFYTPPVHQ